VNEGRDSWSDGSHRPTIRPTLKPLLMVRNERSNRMCLIDRQIIENERILVIKYGIR
jgi:hypothetical protein